VGRERTRTGTFADFTRARLYNKNSKISRLNNDAIKKRGKCGIEGAYQIDHIFSIMEGFRNNIPSEIIGNKINLRLIPWMDNVKKSRKCDMTKEELLQIYREVVEHDSQ
jgi:hypothetical protein